MLNTSMVLSISILQLLSLSIPVYEIRDAEGLLWKPGWCPTTLNSAQLSMPSEWRVKSRLSSVREWQRAEARLMFGGTCF